MIKTFFKLKKRNLDNNRIFFFHLYIISNNYYRFFMYIIGHLIYIDLFLLNITEDIYIKKKLRSFYY